MGGIKAKITATPELLGQKARVASLATTLSAEDIVALTPYKAFQTDAAFRQRISMQTTLGEYKMLNNVFASLILEQVGTGTFTNNTNRVTMSVAAGQYAIIRSKLFHPYFNGKSHLIEMTTAAMGTAADVEKSIGYISSTAVAPYATALDGFRLFKSTADVYSIQVWRNGVNTINVVRSSWYDPLDGTGPSGMTITWSNFNVFFFDFLYLGGTALRVFCMYNGEPILVNTYYYSNTDSTPIFLSPNKDIRYELRSTTGAGSLDFICGLVSTEGPGKEEGTTITINAPNAGITPLATGITYALCGVRKATTQRDIFVEIKNFEGVISTNDFINLELRLNPTVAGVFTYSALTNTPLETATGAITNTVTGGTVIANTYFSLNMNNSKEVKSILAQLNSTINNTMDTIVLCATPALGSNNVKVTGSMTAMWYNQ
jgi:hypothetical protein